MAEAEDIDKLIEWLEAEDREARNVYELRTGKWPDLPFSRLGAAAGELKSLRSRVSELEVDLHAIKYEVMGGEDVPGSAIAATLEDVKAEMERLRRIERNRVSELEAELALAADECKDFEQSVAEAGASATLDDVDAKLLAAFDAVRAEVIDSSLCDASEGLSSLVFSQLSDFRLRLHEYFAHRLAAASTPPAAEAVGGDVEALIVAAYERGAEWANDNVGSGEFLSKAARDYADATMSELQRERGAGPAASLPMPPYSFQTEGGTSSVSTASDDLVDEIGRSMDVQYAIGAIINNEGTFFDGRGESMDRLVRAILSSPPIVKIRDALDHIHMHAFQAGDLMMMPRIEYLAADIDGVLSRFQSVGGEKQDHADGTSAEAVEKVTQPG